jgi:hypothetical protein
MEVPQTGSISTRRGTPLSGTAEVNSTDIFTVVYTQSRADQPVIAIEMIPRLRFTGSPGCRYEIQRAPTPTGPWEIIGFIVAPPGGDIEYIDTSVTSGAYFYRVSSL